MAATKYVEVEVWILVNAEGEWVADEREDEINNAYEERVGAMNEAHGLRTVKATIKVPLPTVIELAGEVVVDELETGLKVA